MNRSLAMEKIKCFGFDMDYTLAGMYTNLCFINELVANKNKNALLYFGIVSAYLRSYLNFV